MSGMSSFCRTARATASVNHNEQAAPQLGSCRCARSLHIAGSAVAAATCVQAGLRTAWRRAGYSWKRQRIHVANEQAALESTAATRQPAGMRAVPGRPGKEAVQILMAAGSQEI
jgi:hypothetical protein